MATTVQHLVERIYEVLVDGAGTTRTLAAAERFDRLRASRADRKVLATRARARPLVDVHLADARPDEVVARVVPAEHHYVFTVRIYRLYFLGHESIPAQVEATQVRATDDLMRTAAALEHPSNMLQTEGAVSTGIGGPGLRLLRSQLLRADAVGDGADRLVTYRDEYEAVFSFDPDA